MPSPETHELASAGVAPTALAAASTTGNVPPTPATVATKAAVAVETSPDFMMASGVRALDHRLQQDLAAGADIDLGCVLDLVVADAVLAGHEHHRRRRDPADVTGVVARAAHDVHVLVARGLGAAPHRVDQLLGEGRRRKIPDLLDLHFEPVPPGDVLG